jgi:hypothetical protein
MLLSPFALYVSISSPFFPTLALSQSCLYRSKLCAIQSVYTPGARRESAAQNITIRLKANKSKGGETQYHECPRSLTDARGGTESVPPMGTRGMATTDKEKQERVKHKKS